jgi:hypothetical protein
MALNWQAATIRFKACGSCGGSLLPDEWVVRLATGSVRCQTCALRMFPTESVPAGSPPAEVDTHTRARLGGEAMERLDIQEMRRRLWNRVQNKPDVPKDWTDTDHG